MSALAPGPGDLGGRLPAHWPCSVCDGVPSEDDFVVCATCEQRLQDEDKPELLAEVYQLEHTLSVVDADRWQARRERDEARGEVVRLRRAVIALWERFGTGEKHTGWNGCGCPDPEHLGDEFAEALGLDADWTLNLDDARALVDVEVGR